MSQAPMAMRAGGILTALRSRPFAALSLAQLQSIVGDQCGRVGLSVLVFEWSHSAFITAVAYGLTFLPALVGSVVLGPLIDSYPRRTVLLTVDVIRGLCFAAMALPATPPWAVLVLLVPAVGVGSAFQAAAPALAADLFDDGPLRVAAFAVRNAVSQLGALLGFAVAGALVAALGTRPTLAADAVSFGLSVLLLLVGLAGVPAAATNVGAKPRIWDGLRVAAATSRRRNLLGLIALIGFWVVPESIATPYVAAHHGSRLEVGLLLAALPLGALVGSLLIGRAAAAASSPRVAPLLALLTGIPLIVTVADPPVAVAAVLWAVAGLGTGYMVLATSGYVSDIPAATRGQCLAVMSGLLLAVQGLGSLFAGAIASPASPSAAVAVAGVCGSLGAAVLLGRTRV